MCYLILCDKHIVLQKTHQLLNKLFMDNKVHLYKAVIKPIGTSL